MRQEVLLVGDKVLEELVDAVTNLERFDSGLEEIKLLYDAIVIFRELEYV